MNDERRRKLNAQRLAGCADKIKTDIPIVISELEAIGIKPLITCGFRSVAEQNRLYAQGRTRAGKIVTNAKGGQSKHNFGKAVDFAFIDSAGNISWDLKLFRKLAVLCKARGFKWGGDWKKFKDYPHIEI